ncbi:TetR/AcrR family transcriptional regulator [Mycoplasmatota bacterium WC44]
MKNQTNKAIRKREDILTNSTKMFMERGIDNVSVNDIVNSMNISKGSFYYHFRSKNELIYEVIFKDELKVEEYYNKFKNRYDSAKLLKMVVTFIAESISKLNAKEFMNFQANVLKDHFSRSEYSENIINPIFMTYDRIISDGVMNGTFRSDINRLDLVESMFSMSLGAVFSWGYSNGKNDIVRNANIMVDMLLNGMIEKNIL